MKKSHKALLIGTGILSLGMTAFAFVSYSITKELVKVALDRDPPKSSTKSRFRISGTLEKDSMGKKISDAAEQLKNSCDETIEIKGPGGEKLVGHLRLSDNAERIIIAVHGWRSSWNNDFGMIADFWQKSKSHVLYVEQRCHNSSEGDHMGFGMIERYDCLCWINWVMENLNHSLPVYLAGTSMGASTVLMTLGLNLPENVRGVIADSGFTSAHDIWKHVTENNLHLSYKMMGFLADSMCKKKINMGTREYSTKDALRTSSVPVLFIHGAHDKFVPVEMTYENYLAAKGEKELLIVPGAGHCRSYLVDRNRYEKTVLKFWKRYDSKQKELY